MRVIKRPLKRLLSALGYEVRRIDGGSGRIATGPDLWVWLRASQTIRTIIDIGANDGAFGEFLATYFKAKATYAFEPLRRCIPQIEGRAGAIPGLKVFHMGLSDREGTASFYENTYGPASSLLRVSDRSKAEFPQTSGEEAVTVELRRLDDVLDVSRMERDLFIKIDVQGVEDAVIRGGRKVFEAAKFVLIEMSFVSMYEGQPLFEEVHAQLAGLGFRLMGIKNQIDAPKTGQPLFAHCLYGRTGW